MSATTDTVTAIATCVGAGTTIVLAIATICALADWKNTLKNEREDDCAGSAADFDGAIGRWREAKRVGSEWEPTGYDQMWTALRGVKIAVWRARRHYDELQEFAFKTIEDQLRDLRRLPSADAERIHGEIMRLLRPVHSIPPVPTSSWWERWRRSTG
jgi:hypothetical protein